MKGLRALGRPAVARQNVPIMTKMDRRTAGWLPDRPADDVASDHARPPSGSEECQQIGKEPVAMGEDESMRRILIDDQFRIRDEPRRSRSGHW